MLDHHQIPATFFVTAVDAMLHPDMLEAIQSSGRHEIGVHGWIHETPTRGSVEEVRKVVSEHPLQPSLVRDDMIQALPSDRSDDRST